MESHENLSRYDDVNREIQRMLASKEEKIQRIVEPKHDKDLDVLTLLENLNKTYNEINMALKTESSEALKDTILKSDIKMSMVCETLLETLKKALEDKKALYIDNQTLDKTKRDLENKMVSSKLELQKLNSELEFKKRNLEELNRIIKDQKDRMNEYKEETDKSKNELLFYKAKMNELENLRNRANEKLATYEKEREAMAIYIKEKENRCNQLMLEKKEEENKNSNIKTRILELDSLVEVLNKKNEVKDKNLSLCNGELSKLLCENKKLKADYEKYKESSYYYEGLYNSINSQNSYLNSELNKMLKNVEYNKDIEGFITKYKEKKRKMKRKYKKLKKEIEVLKEKQEEKKDNINEETFNADETSDTLMKQIEDLKKRNDEYKKQLDRLEAEKKSVEERVKNLNIKKHVLDVPEERNKHYTHSNKPYSNFRFDTLNRDTHAYKSKDDTALGFRDYRNPDKLSFRNDNVFKQTDWRNNYNYPDTANFRWNTNKEANNIYSESRTFNNYRTNKDSEFGHNAGSYKIERHIDNNEPINSTYLKLFNLENNYDEQIPKNEFVGGFADDSDMAEGKLNLDYGIHNNNKELAGIREMHTNRNDQDQAVVSSKGNNNIEQKGIFDSEAKFKQSDSQLPSLNKNKNFQEFIQMDDKANNQSIPTSSINKKSIQKNNIKADTFKLKEDDNSAESIKTYHTTSTLKEMMAKTDNLQKKFQALEDQLANIKEGESIDKLTDKIKTYNSYYSDWNGDSNESDYI